MKAVNSEAKPIVRVAKIVPLQIGEWSGKFYLMLVPLDDFHFSIGFGILAEDKSLRFTASRWYPEMQMR
ncbi:hypothetical protein SLE2022_403990 [Rubroshorea leprosula]